MMDVYREIDEIECAEGRFAVAVDIAERAMEDFIADVTPIGDSAALEVARCSFEQSFKLLRKAVLE